MSDLIAKTKFHSKEDAVAYILECEATFQAQTERVANNILRQPQIKMLGLGGPTCAGKTTAAALLIHHLKKAGKHVHIVSIDDFFKEQPEARQKIQRENEQKTLDFDSFDALDFSLMEQCVRTLMKEGTVTLPKYDLSTGHRKIGQTLTIYDDNDLFLFEGIQTVYPQVNRLLREYPYYSMYISVNRSLVANHVIYEPHQLRLLRRLVRDYYRRASTPEFTLYLWNSVRKNEVANILPYATQCDEQMDSLMGYEISMLRPYLETILPSILSSNLYGEIAATILHDIKTVEPLSAELLPTNSLYREFVGKESKDS